MICLGTASEHVMYNTETKCVIDYDPHIKADDKKYVYIGYAWFNESGKWDDTEIPLAFYITNRDDIIVKDPCWNWIKKERTDEQQQWIEDNWDAIENAWDEKYHH